MNDSAPPGVPRACAPRKVLLVDPLQHVHSILHYRAALNSAGFEETEFTVFTTVLAERERERLEEFARAQPRLRVIFGGSHGPVNSRWQCWRHYGRAMRRVERILAGDPFDFLVYLMADFALPFLGFGGFRVALPRHQELGLRGLVFRSMGLRPPAPHWRPRLNAAIDRLILRQALRGGAVRKLSFLDPYCADRAAQLFHTDLCGRGIDPVEIPAVNTTAAREKLGLGAADFVALMFGSIDKRKGVLDALALLRAAGFAHRELVLVVAGKVDPELREPLEQMIRSCAGLFRVVLHDRFITDDELPGYFAAADCTLCPYKNFTASSGVLLHGASCGNLAMVSPGGAMEDAVREFGFGEIVRLEDPAGFVQSLRRLMSLAPAERAKMSAGALAYARSRDPRLYMGQF